MGAHEDLGRPRVRTITIDQERGRAHRLGVRRLRQRRMERHPTGCGAGGPRPAHQAGTEHTLPAVDRERVAPSAPPSLLQGRRRPRRRRAPRPPRAAHRPGHLGDRAGHPRRPPQRRALPCPRSLPRGDGVLHRVRQAADHAAHPDQDRPSLRVLRLPSPPRHHLPATQGSADRQGRATGRRPVPHDRVEPRPA